MKKITSIILLALVSTSLLVTGCQRESTHNKYQKQTHQTVKVYKQHAHNNSGVVNNNTSDNSDLLFWYIMMYHGNYYSYSSPTYISPNNYSSVNWQESKTAPVEIQNDVPVEVNTVPNAELGTQVDSVIEATETTSQAESAGYDNSSSDNANSDAQESTMSGESSPSSSGGESSSGGDSGGGDGGGGGGD